MSKIEFQHVGQTALAVKVNGTWCLGISDTQGREGGQVGTNGVKGNFRIYAPEGQSQPPESLAHLIGARYPTSRQAEEAILAAAN